MSRWDVSYFFGVHSVKSKFNLEYLGNILTPRKERIKPNEYDGLTPIVSKIPFEKSHIEYRKEPRTRMDMYAVLKDDLLVSNINFHQGAISLCDIDKAYASTHYQPYIINREIILDKYLVLILKQKSFQDYVATKKVKGIKTESNFNFIKTLQIPLPPLEIQKEIVAKIEDIKNKIKALQEEEKRLKDEIEAYIYI
ncbi:restriction endonuclease subunit S [Campylobacter sp. MIT 99-7217]|uniref:restriction endonuclease subunit S n=1 Tax=Campylobacter sp. MIT 99-7217 TaxID=535091 RepID=UPI00163B73AD|nr:restriction endonuclease subunit S [Campylobacter sp. MIT 99-7217]